MSEQALQDAYATLKLTMDSNQAMIEAAHRQHRELFNNTSIACYSLCSEAEQEESLKAVAADMGRDPFDLLYDWMLELDG